MAGLLQGSTPGYDFGPGRTMQEQAMNTFEEFAGNQRNAALENAGAAFTQGGDALNAALASRGLSANSGAAIQGLSDLANQGAQSRVNLERDLANQAGQIGLDATKFDISSGLQREGMESGFAANAANIANQALGTAGQLGLGAGQNALTNQGQASQFELARTGQVAQNLMGAGDLARTGFESGVMNPLAMQQQMYQQNQIAPYMQMMGMADPGGMLANILAAQGGNLERRADQNVGGNMGGFATGMGSLAEGIGSGIKGKGGGGMNPSQTGAFNQALWGGSSNFPY